MDAGKALDAFVAENLLGWKNRDGKWYADGSATAEALPAFSTDLNFAWTVTDFICDKGFRLQLSGARIWQARFYKSQARTLETQALDATGRTPAETICLAALAVMGIGLPGKT